MMAAFVPKVMSFIVRRSTTTGHSSSGPAAAAWKCTRYISSPTFPLLEKRTMKVPSMGDSITEVSIALLRTFAVTVDWSKNGD